MVEEFAFDNTEERRKVRQNGTGWIEVIAGSMFSGKSEELIRRLNRARIARQKVQVFKPKIDARYSVDEIASHSGHKHESLPVTTAADLMAEIREETQVVVDFKAVKFMASAMLGKLVAMKKKCAEVFDYGNNIRQRALDAGYADAFAFVYEFKHPLS